VVEAILLGASSEMGTELLFRGYPTDRRGTYFRHMWEYVEEPAPYDIAPIHTWSRELGKNKPKGFDSPVTDRLVLLIRGRLLLRYPETVVYITSASSSQIYEPTIHGFLPPDLVFLGFALDSTAVRSNPERYQVVFAEQPSAPRFGLDIVHGRGPENPTRDELYWSPSEDGTGGGIAVQEGEYITEQSEWPSSIADVMNPARSDRVAWALAQKPVRLTVSGERLVSQLSR
jgi:hypothetical protein